MTTSWPGEVSYASRSGASTFSIKSFPIIAAAINGNLTKPISVHQFYRMVNVHIFVDANFKILSAVAERPQSVHEP